MKKTRSRLTMLLVVLAYYVAFSNSLSAQSGLSCVTAIQVPAHGGCDYSESTSSLETWYSFVTDSTKVEIDVSSDDGGATAISNIILYSGSCASLTPVSGTVIVSDFIKATFAGLTRNTSYYIKLTKGNTNTTAYALCVINLNPNPLTCGSGCPSNPNNNSNTTCEAVCNGGFEYFANAPWQLGCINEACPWNHNGQGNATTDLFNVNAYVTQQNGGATVKVPKNAPGWQQPKAGNGYAGIVTYASTLPNFREYVVQPLLVPLQAGKRYRVSFWVSLGNYVGYKTSGMGAYLSATNPNLLGNSGIMAQNPQIKGALYNTAISDTLNWVLITDTITPSVTMNYIAIGCFKNDASNNYTVVPHQATPFPNTGVTGQAYYFVDEVSILPDGAISVTASPNPACSNVPVMFAATSSIGNGNYTWSATNNASWNCYGSANCDSITSILPSYSTSIYTATTTLPGFGNCTASASVQPSWLNGPTSAYAGADQSICTGGSATLTGASTGPYNVSSWSILTGGTLCTNCSTTVVSPTTTTYYVYTVTYSVTGCSKSDTIKVTPVPLSVSIVSPQGATVCGGCFNFTTTSAYASYSWSTNAVSSSGGNTSTLNACWGPPFTMTNAGNVSVSVVDANGCQGSTYVNIATCCEYMEGDQGGFPNLINDSTSHVFSTQSVPMTVNGTFKEVSNVQFAINGIFIVNQNTRFKGCLIKLGPNAKIIVSPGKIFELTNGANNVTVLSSCDQMWDGIYVDGTNGSSQVIVKNGTVIEDAKNAIVSINGGKFSVGNSSGATVKLNKNNIGVLIKPYAGTHPGVISNAIISCDAPGQSGSTSGVTSAGANCKSPINDIGFAGVYVDGCMNVIIGDSTSNAARNWFERTQYGVYSKGSNVKVWNNNFRYFTTTVIGKNVPINGVAVYASAGKFVPKSLYVGKNGNYKAKNKFTKCNYGVLAHNYMDLYCEFNRFDSCMTKGIYTLNCVSRNIIINKDTLTECTGTNIACVESANSTVLITNNTINQSQAFTNNNYGQTGIYVANALLVNVALKIQYNSIKKMRNGIWVSRVDKAKITDNNPITFMPGQPMSQGSPCIGIKLEEVSNSLIRQNSIAISSAPTVGVHDELFGIHMTNCKNDTISKNLFSRLGSGIFLKGSNNPCILACNTMIACWYGINFNYLNGYGTAVSINDQITWTSANTPYSTGNGWSGCDKDLTGRIMPVNSNGIRWYYNGYNPNVTAMFTNSLYGNATTYAANGDRCQQMIAPPSQSQEAQRNFALAGICKTPRTYDTLNSQFQYHDKVFAYRMLRQNPTWKSLGTADDSYYSNFYTTYSSGNIGKFADVEDSLAVGKVAGGLTLLASIIPSGQYEVNRKTVLSIYGQTWGIDSMNLDSTQQAILLGIVNQGMLTGGTSVFDARNMLQLEVHDSSSVRVMSPESTSTLMSKLSPVYPNPSSTTVSFDMVVDEGRNGTFEMFDLTGRKVGSWQLVGGLTNYSFDVSFLTSGTYLYRITMGTEMLKSDRIVIIRQ